MAKRDALRLTFLFVVLVISATPVHGQVNTLSSAQIIARSYSEQCLDWKITGACIWLRCSLFGCRIVTTPRISHRLPDYVVAAYSQTGQSPWRGGQQHIPNPTRHAVNELSGGGISGVGATDQLTDELKFNEVDVIGGPVMRLTGFNRFLCRRTSRPLFPYFVSLQDAAAWRSGLPDHDRREAREPGLREIGSWPDFTWGSVYPRTGFVIQAHSGKAAAVASQRAIDIVLRDGTGHVTGQSINHQAQPVTRGDAMASNPKACQVSGGRWEQTPKLGHAGRCVKQVWYQWLGKADEKTDRWQMLLPHPTNRCETFGEQLEWRHPGVAENGGYVWNYWAKYKCCVKGGGVLLKHFDF